MTAIVVLNWNGLDDTLESVKSIIEQTVAPYHLFVIDNASQSDELAEIRENFNQPNITFVQNAENLGFCKAHIHIWHEEIKGKSYDYLALINNDTVVTERWLTHMIECADTHNADMISGKMVFYNNRNTIDNLGHHVIATGEIVPVANQELEDQYTSTITNHGPCAGGALYSTEMLNEIGFFDPYFDTGYEDAEYGLRATVLGYQSVLCPEAVIYHKGGASIKKVFNIEYAIRNQINVLYSFVKLFPLGQLIVYVPLVILKSLIIAVLGLVFGRLNFSKVTLKSLFRFFMKGHFSEAIRARKETFQNRKRINSLKFYLNQKSFLSFHLKRAFDFLIKRKPSALEQYR